MSGNVETVKITLDGDDYELKPTLLALKRINQLGGIMSALRALDAFDAEAYFVIIEAGLNWKKRSELEEKIFVTGIRNLNAPLGKFCLLVSNGGRDPDSETGEAKGEE